jgi:hypothetical protein
MSEIDNFIASRPGLEFELSQLRRKVQPADTEEMNEFLYEAKANWLRLKQDARLKYGESA